METTHELIFETCRVRIAGTNSAPVFCASDICAALEIQNPADLLKKSIPEPEKGLSLFPTGGGALQEMLHLTEAGLYRVIFRSTKPKAEAFRQWVFREVLPTVRRTGRYEVGEPTALAGEPEAAGVDVRLRSLLWITLWLVQLGAKPDRAADVASKAVPRLLGAAGGKWPALAAPNSPLTEGLPEACAALLAIPLIAIPLGFIALIADDLIQEQEAPPC